jgi:hypothetical protein
MYPAAAMAIEADINKKKSTTESNGSPAKTGNTILK